jgi:hypothetical protein
MQGWHVLIGENGSGKSTIIRALSLAILGPGLAPALRESWGEWIAKGKDKGNITIDVDIDHKFDGKRGRGRKTTNYFIPASITIQKKSAEGQRDYYQLVKHLKNKDDFDPENYLWSDAHGWFSAAFGPFRRFRGGEKDKEKLFGSYPRVGAHVTAYGEDAALTEVESWLIGLYNRKRDGHKESEIILSRVQDFINNGGLLPHKSQISKITTDGIFFIDGKGAECELSNMSDGFRSILSLTMELIRQLLLVYGHEKVLKGKAHIDVPGVVLIDEIDAHLHPTWQTRIGQWFTKYFPKLQFIVTTHSPLICRACGEHGKIFRLAAPGSPNPSGEITGVERDRLVYGDILEAYETDMFGDGVEWSEEGRALQKEYRELTIASRYDAPLSQTQKDRLAHLKQIFHANVEAS